MCIVTISALSKQYREALCMFIHSILTFRMIYLLFHSQWLWSLWLLCGRYWWLYATQSFTRRMADAWWSLCGKLFKASKWCNGSSQWWTRYVHKQLVSSAFCAFELPFNICATIGMLRFWSLSIFLFTAIFVYNENLVTDNFLNCNRSF